MRDELRTQSGMNLFAMLLPVLFGGITVAQVPPVIPPSVITSAASASAALNNGPCMDSPRSVPLALQPPAVTAMQGRSDR